MRVLKTKPILHALMAAIVGLTLTACGKSSDDNSNVYSQGGYYPPGTTGPGGQVSGQCAPITGPIPFTIQGAYMDWANIVGGQIPFSSQAIGSVLVGGGAAGGQYVGQGSDGTISMQLMPGGYPNQGYMPYSGYPNQSYPGQPGQYAYGYNNAYGGQQFVSGAGTIQLSALVIQDIVYKVQTGQIPIGLNGGYQQPGYGYPQYPQYNQINPQQICVSAIAMNLGHYYNKVYGGKVYLYLNGTSRGYVMYF